ncbi:MAG: hypothetical protein AVDCRST_MAG93-4133, partial [uncultured Chloroflexia bacterium]
PQVGLVRALYRVDAGCAVAAVRLLGPNL